MRFGVLVSALIFWTALDARAQAPATTVTPPKPIYFVVDASGSMQGQNREEAELLLRALSLPHDQPVSMIFFGSKPETPNTNLCFEAFDVAKPLRRGQDFSPKLPDLGGKDDQTAITNAIDQVLGKIDGPAKLIIITDGEERCNKNFSEIRERHPDAEDIEIEVRQVGNSPNAELQKLQERPPPKPAITPSPSPNKVEVHVALDPNRTNAWDQADWPERYFWLLPYMLLAVAAGFFGSSFGNTARRYNDEITRLQNQRRLADDHFAQKGERLKQNWPPFLSESDASKDGDDARRISLALFLLAFAAGLPLIVLNGATQGWAIVVQLFAPLVVLVLLFIVPLRRKLRVDEALPSELANKIGLAVFAILISVTYYLIDGDLARGAAWVVLSSGFSAALAIVASAPLLFAGSQLGQLDRAKSSYKHTWDHGLDEQHRQEMAEAREKQDERNRVLSNIFGWMFPPSTTTPFQRRKLQRDQDAVRKYLGSLAREVAEKAKKTNDNSSLLSLHQTGDLVGAIKTVVQISELNLSEQIRNALSQLAEAYDSPNQSGIAVAFSEAAKIVQSK
tara:strand:+ start:3657 stop:5348 length:1692 start_codon:yes stop_codon:yes gene_type:complete